MLQRPFVCVVPAPHGLVQGRSEQYIHWKWKSSSFVVVAMDALRFWSGLSFPILPPQVFAVSRSEIA